MTDQPAPRPLSDVDLLVWAVVLSYRDQQERDGITILALPFPPCPTCGETVHKVVASWVRESLRDEVTIDVQPCEHAHTATFADLERIHDHASEMLASLRLDDRLPGGKGRSTDDIVREAHARVGEPKETSRGPIDWARRQQAERDARQTTSAVTEATEPALWSQLEAHAFNAVQPALQEVGEWLPLSVRRAVARAVLAAVQPHLAGHYQHAVDAAVAAEQRAVQAEAAAARVREVADRIRQGAPWTANHDDIADHIEAALKEQP